MRRILLPALACAALAVPALAGPALAGPASAGETLAAFAEGGAQVRHYVGLGPLAGAGYLDVGLTGGALVCDGVPGTTLGVGGGCFDVPPGARTMHLEAFDVGGRVWLITWFLDAQGAYLDTEDTCGGALPVPEGAARAAVFPFMGECGGMPVLGTLRARF